MNPLTKLQKLILDVLHPHDSREDCVFIHYDLQNMLKDKNAKCDFSYTEIETALHDLKKRELLYCEFLSNGVCFIFLYHRGKRYKEIRNKKFKLRLADWAIGFVFGVFLASVPWLLGAFF